MSFNYDGLWSVAFNRKISKTQLRDLVGISNSTLSKLSKNETVSMEVLGRICETLDCSLKDIVEYRKEI